MVKYKITRDEDNKIKGLKKEINRRDFLKKTGLTGLALFLSYLGFSTINEEDEKPQPFTKYVEIIGNKNDNNDLYENYPELEKTWNKIHPEETEDLEKIVEYDDKITEPRYTFKGRYERTKRFEDKIKEVEKKYNIPENLLFVLIMRESYGEPLTVNEKDGGSGLGCLQPRIAKHYGLKTYNNKRVMISKDYGEDLVKLVKKYNNNLDELKKIHEPFDPDKCIPVIGEFLFDFYKELGDWEKAVMAYNCGIDNFLKNKPIPSITKRHVEKINEYIDSLYFKERLE